MNEIKWKSYNVYASASIYKLRGVEYGFANENDNIADLQDAIKRASTLRVKLRVDGGRVKLSIWRPCHLESDDPHTYINCHTPLAHRVNVVTSGSSEPALSVRKKSTGLTALKGGTFANKGYVKAIQKAVDEVDANKLSEVQINNYTMIIANAITLFKGSRIIAKGYRSGRFNGRCMPTAYEAREVKTAESFKVLLYTDEGLDAGKGVDTKRVKSYPFKGGEFEQYGEVVAAVPLYSCVYSEHGFVCWKRGSGAVPWDAYFLPTFVIVRGKEDGKFLSFLVMDAKYAPVGACKRFSGAVRRIADIWTGAIFNPKDKLEREVGWLLKARFLKLVPRRPTNEEAADAVIAEADRMIAHMFLWDSIRVSAYSTRFNEGDFFLFRVEEVAKQTGLGLNRLKQLMCDADESFASRYEFLVKGRHTDRSIRDLLRK